MRALRKGRTSIVSVFALLAIASLLASCGGGGDGSSSPSGGGTSSSSGSSGVSTEVVGGVASGSAPLAGQVTIQDSSTPAQKKSTVIASDGSYALDVSGMKGPFVLEAAGRANGTDYKLYSFAEAPGTANINPLASAVVAHAAGVKDPEEVYKNPDHDTLDRVKSRLPQTIAEFLAKLKPLLVKYSAENDDPITCRPRAGLRGLFRDVNITLAGGILTITNAKTGAVIFSGPVTDIVHGHFTDDDDDLPSPGAAPATPTGITATGGSGQVTISWAPVGNATSYNLYWAATPGVTPADGTKIAGITSPYVMPDLAAGTSYYFIVTALNSAGESAASSQVSATTDAALAAAPAVPAAPTGVMATGGTNQVTVSWSAVSGASSYNLYWSTTSGVTPATGTKIEGVTSPAVQTGLSASTTYYYIVTAVNSAGESATSSQAAATTLDSIPAPTVPAAPTGVGAVGGASGVTVSWSAVSGATSYNLYWSTTSGVTSSTGTRIAGVTSPYVHTGLSAGTSYYYIVTAVNSAGESAASTQASATTDPPPPAVPAAPTGVTATGGARQVSISWSAAPGATSYNLYWSTTSGATTATGTKIAGVTSPYVHTGLADGTTYYYILTGENSTGEGTASAQASATTDAAAFDAAAYYAANCAGCHSSGYRFTASQLQNGIDANKGGMGKFNNLTAAQVAAIAARP